MSNEPQEKDYSKLTEDQINKLTKILNHKQLFKDPLSSNGDTINNCLSVTPFKTLSSYNLWIRRNLLYLTETEEYIYPSGTNIIIEKVSSKL